MIALEDLPEPLRVHAAAQNWRRVSVTPIHLEGSIVAAYVLFGWSTLVVAAARLLL